MHWKNGELSKVIRSSSIRSSWEAPYPEILHRLKECPTVTQIYRVTGECCLHVHAVAADREELERLMNEVLDPLPGVKKLTTYVILSREKDVKGLRL